MTVKAYRLANLINFTCALLFFGALVVLYFVYQQNRNQLEEIGDITSYQDTERHLNKIIYRYVAAYLDNGNALLLHQAKKELIERRQLVVQQLSPRFQSTVTKQIDPLLQTLETEVLALGKLAGAPRELVRHSSRELRDLNARFYEYIAGSESDRSALAAEHYSYARLFQELTESATSYAKSYLDSGNREFRLRIDEELASIDYLLQRWQSLDRLDSFIYEAETRYSLWGDDDQEMVRIEPLADYLEQARYGINRFGREIDATRQLIQQRDQGLLRLQQQTETVASELMDLQQKLVWRAQRRAEQSQRVLFLAAVLILAVLAAVRVALQYGLKAPLVRLVEAAREIAKGNFHQLLIPSGVAEVRELMVDAQRLQNTLRHQEAERSRVNSELVAARDEALASARAKGQFLANMSHEIRTPMNGFIGMLELLKDEKLTVQQAELVRTARDSAHALLGLINDVLDFSRLDSGEVQVERVETDCAELVEDVVALFAPQAESQSLPLYCDIDTSLPKLLQVDPTKIRQILSNLIGNALKFTATGSISVELACEQIGRTQMLLRLAVRDSGIGIPPEKQDSIFSVFAQADDSTTRLYGGTGLGLAICRGLAEAMGGTINLRSTPGSGSTFTLQVPVAGSFGKSPLVEVSQYAALIIKDHYLRDIASRYLLAGGYQVVAASVGVPLAMIVVDISSQDWAEQLAQLRNLRTDWPPVILLSPLQEKDSGVNVKGPLYRCFLPLKRGFYHVIDQRVSDDSSLPILPISDQQQCCLLVEDNPVNRKVASRMLKKFGVEVETAENGEQAVRACAARQFDLVLMDCQMPVMDGFQATRVIRQAQREGSPTQTIIALTANAMEGDEQRCLEAGMDGYLTKPLTTKALQRGLETWLEVQPEQHCL